MGVYSQVRLGVSCLLRVYLGAKSQVGWECAIECNGSVLERDSEAYLRAYSGVYLGVS